MDIQIPHDIVVVSSYFNPNGYKTKRVNYEKFVKGLSEVKGATITIECAFNDDPFDLPESPCHLQVRASGILWQKERLLNLVIGKLPSHITKIAWIDCDLIFENANWLAETSRQLESCAVVQPFEVAVRLPRDQDEDNGQGDRYAGFAATFKRNPLSLTAYGKFTRHGHTGFAWAARRDALPYGLYDGCISGNGDHLMAHAFAGDWETECFRSQFEDNYAYWEHFETWCHNTYPHVRSRIGYVPGKALHLWHGESNERRYMERNGELNAFAFDPAKDIRIGKDGCYHWNSDKPDLHRWAKRYFTARNEDGKSLRYPTKEKLVDRLDRARDRACSPAHESRLMEMMNAVGTADSIAEAIALTREALGIGNN
jgi:hypothetical protein